MTTSVPLGNAHSIWLHSTCSKIRLGQGYRLTGCLVSWKDEQASRTVLLGVRSDGHLIHEDKHQGVLLLHRLPDDREEGRHQLAAL